jgi:ABC-2 type transport system ATP-binding protein
MIRVEDLTKRFGATQALSGLSFEVAEGEVFGFIGPNGAGKTTLLRVLAGLSKPTHGRAEVGGIDVSARPGAVHQITGYMPDFFGVYDSMTAAEHLGFYAACHRIQKRLSTRVVDDLLELVRLNDKRDTPVGSLSRGMKQRLCLARALVHDPKVLLLDDPASGLDPRARSEMRQLVGALQQMGKTVLLSSHVLAELAEMCTSVGVVHQGRMVAVGDFRQDEGGLEELFMKVTGPEGEGARSAPVAQGDLAGAQGDGAGGDGRRGAPGATGA